MQRTSSEAKVGRIWLIPLTSRSSVRTVSFFLLSGASGHQVGGIADTKGTTVFLSVDIQRLFDAVLIWPSQTRGKGTGMEMLQVRYVLAAAKLLNFTKSARQCNVS